MKSNIQAVIWTVIGAVATAGILAGVGFTWSTHIATNEMKIELNKMCTLYPDLKSRVERMDIEVQTNKMGDIETRGRVFFLEKSLEAFEKRIANIKK